MEIFFVSLLFFLCSIGALAVAQWVRQAPLPVGCTPVNGECCQLSGDACCREPEDNLVSTISGKI